MTKTINFKVDWLTLFIILLPTFYVFGKDLRLMQMNFYQISIFVLIALFHVNKYIGALLLWAIFQFLFFKDSPSQSHLLTNLFLGAVVYHFITKYASPESFKKYFWAFWGVLLLSCFWIGLQVNQIDPIWIASNNPQQNTFISEYSGWFGLPQFMGAYASAVLPLGFLLHPLLFPFALIALCCGKSSFAILGGLVASLFFWWFRKRIVFWIIILVFGAGSLFWVMKYDKPGGQFHRRLNMWGLVIEKSFQKQFLGYGLGSYHQNYTFLEFQPNNKVAKNGMVQNNQELLGFLIVQSDKLPSPQRENVLSVLTKINPKQSLNLTAVRDLISKNGADFNVWSETHNEFLQSFFEFGFLGLFFILGYFYDLFKRFFKLGLQKEKICLALAAAVIAIVINSIGHFPFHVARLAGPFLVIMALFETMIFRYEEA